MNKRYSTFFPMTSFEKETKWYDNLLFFLWGWLGFQLLGLIVSAIAQPYVSDFTWTSVQGSMFVNFLVYGIVFPVFLFYLWWRKPVALKDIFKGFVKGRNLWIGLLIFLVSSFVASLYQMLVNAIVPWMTVNANQSTVVSLTTVFPFEAFLMTVVMAPFTEELTYRGGLQTLIGRWSSWAGVLLTAVIFGLIHFDFEGSIASAIAGNPYVLYRELLNLPVYVLSGLGLGLAYQYTGSLSASMFCHFFNNLLAFIQLF